MISVNCTYFSPNCTYDLAWEPSTLRIPASSTAMYPEPTTATRSGTCLHAFHCIPRLDPKSYLGGKTAFLELLRQTTISIYWQNSVEQRQLGCCRLFCFDGLLEAHASLSSHDLGELYI